MSLRVAVCGLWHLGCVTAACVAEHFETVGYDPDAENIRRLSQGLPPILELGLPEALQAGVRSGRLSFTHSAADALRNAQVAWITYDTPVNADDVADPEYVTCQLESFFPHLADGVLVLISSQLPVGSTACLEAAFRARHPDQSVVFAYSPENLRLGKALEIFRHPDRIVVGIRNEADRARLAELLTPFSSRLEWMSVESAEMTKHALNAFLAMSIAFSNEIAVLCERVGADAKEVERGLKSELRIGPRAYLSPGAAFAGGTLARDVLFLADIGRREGITLHLLPAVRDSNNEHKSWPRRKLREYLGELSGKTIAVLGLTYKPDTDTLRRSSAVELCQWLAGQGAQVRAHDPAVCELPPELRPDIELCGSAPETLRRADAVVIATEWPVFRYLTADDLVKEMNTPLVLDANSFFDPPMAADPRVQYVAVGRVKPKRST